MSTLCKQNDKIPSDAAHPSVYIYGFFCSNMHVSFREETCHELSILRLINGCTVSKYITCHLVSSPHLLNHPPSVYSLSTTYYIRISNIGYWGSSLKAQ